VNSALQNGGLGELFAIPCAAFIGPSVGARASSGDGPHRGSRNQIE
jgi:hypothetical protein